MLQKNSNLSVRRLAAPDEQGKPRFMDQLTKKIITILRRDGRASYSDIARELDTTRDNVASRVNPLFQSGELRVIAALHPRVLGLNVSAHMSLKVTGDPH